MLGNPVCYIARQGYVHSSYYTSLYFLLPQIVQAYQVNKAKLSIVSVQVVLHRQEHTKGNLLSSLLLYLLLYPPRYSYIKLISQSTKTTSSLARRSLEFPPKSMLRLRRRDISTIYTFQLIAGKPTISYLLTPASLQRKRSRIGSSFAYNSFVTGEIQKNRRGVASNVAQYINIQSIRPKLLLRNRIKSPRRSTMRY